MPTLDHLQSSYLVLFAIAALGVAAAILAHTGVLGWALGKLSAFVRGGFRLWERYLSWAAWPYFLIIVLILLAAGGWCVDVAPGVAFLCAAAPLFMGVTACLAYMHIDLERYEVGRGHKAIHNPLMGQQLAADLGKYAHLVGLPLLAAATLAMIGGFSLLNFVLSETIGGAWYAVEEGQATAVFVDFVAYSVINFLRIVDILNLFRSKHLLGVTYVQPVAWPATALLMLFRVFFTFVLLQQIFASLRLGQLLNETIRDFWSPHEPIHERAKNALPQHGAGAIEPLLRSLTSVAFFSKEQRDRVPPILAAIGPIAIPTLVRHLHGPHEQLRAIAAAALGQLRARGQTAALAQLVGDPSDVVRQNVAEALGDIGAACTGRSGAGGRAARPFLARRGLWPDGLRWRWRGAPATPADPLRVAVAALRGFLADEHAGVRAQAAGALGRIGPAAADAAPELAALLADGDETARCAAAAALGAVCGAEAATLEALIGLLQDPSPTVKAAAARALGALKGGAAAAVPMLAPLLQDQEEAVRTAAAEAIAQAGSLDKAATDQLAQGLTNLDNVVRAQTAEALGAIGAPAQETAPALVAALDDPNDVVRAKAVQALGRIGEGAAEVAVPRLVRALRDQDNWVSALAAEALGQMGDAADEAVPALMRSLRHINPQVRGNAAESLGKMGPAAARARPALEPACLDEDGGVRRQAVRALGAIGPDPESEKAVVAALADADPQVRAAAIEALGRLGRAHGDELATMLALLADPNDQVKVQAAQVLPGLTGALPEVVDGLCRQLLEDDSVLVQFHAALALSKLGSAAAAAGGALLRAAQTMEATVREQAMRAIVMIQPPEAEAAFASGLKDANGEIRKMASAGWMKAPAIPEEVIPALVDALRDPEVQVRANAAHALGRLDALPAAAIPALVECCADANDGLRMNAALALKLAPAPLAAEAMEHLVEDRSLRVRFIAASALLRADPAHAKAGAVLAEAHADPAKRLCQAAVELSRSLKANSTAASAIPVWEGGRT